MQQILALISLICVPIMLMGKPLIFLMNSMQKKSRGYEKISTSMTGDFED